MSPAEAALEYYFQCLQNNQPMFMAVRVADNQTVKVYFENTDVASVCRMFFSADDAAGYIRSLKAHGRDVRSMRPWEATPDTIVKFLNGPGLGYADQRRAFLTAVVTVKRDGWWTPMDIFWSNDPRFVV